MKREKIYSWKIGDSAPKLIVDQCFTSGDVGVDFLKFIVDSSFAGMQMQLFIKGGLSTAPAYYNSEIETNGTATFLLSNRELRDSVYTLYAKIVGDGVVTSSIAFKYNVGVIEEITDFTLNEETNKTINEMIDELNETMDMATSKISEVDSVIDDGTDKIDEISSTIMLADSSNLTLSKTIVVSCESKESLSNVIDIANESNATLTNTTEIADESNATLTDTIGFANQKIQEIRSVSAEEIGVIRQVGIDERLDVAKTGADERSKVTSVSNQEQLNIVDVANNKIDEINAVFADSSKNVNDNSRFRFWMGNQDEFNNLPFNQAGIKYDVYDDDGSHVGGKYWKPMAPAEYYDPRVSMVFDANIDGLHYWNNPNDPMPIKTLNMAGLQKWEETDDYIIYLDKDAVMTTVENYIGGTYSLFLERKALIDGTMELLRENEIEWTAEDDSKLLLDINKAQLERIANTPATMEEEDFAPQTFTTRAVPTTYECCFRIDKSSGEIYIGEGYENIWSNSSFETSATVRVSVDKENNRVKLTQITQPTTAFNFYRSVAPTCDGKSTYSSSCFIEKMTTSSYVMYLGARDKGYMINTTYLKSEIARNGATYLGIGLDNLAVVGEEIEAKHFQITKTSTPKPFVKSIMPSGKLAFETYANLNTHSIIFKGHSFTSPEPYGTSYRLYNNDWSWGGRGESISIKKEDVKSDSNHFLSEKFVSDGASVNNFGDYRDSTFNIVRGAYLQSSYCSFKQLIIYRGSKKNLTSATSTGLIENFDFTKKPEQDSGKLYSLTKSGSFLDCAGYNLWTDLGLNTNQSGVSGLTLNLAKQYTGDFTIEIRFMSYTSINSNDRFLTLSDNSFIVKKAANERLYFLDAPQHVGIDRTSDIGVHNFRSLFLFRENNEYGYALGYRKDDKLTYVKHKADILCDGVDMELNNILKLLPSCSFGIKSFRIYDKALTENECKNNLRCENSSSTFENLTEEDFLSESKKELRLGA